MTVSAAAGHHRDAPAMFDRVDYGGKSITFSGDGDAQGLPASPALAQGSGLLGFHNEALPPVLYGLHTPPAVIGTLTRDAAVGQLLLGHLSPAVERAQAEVASAIASAWGGPFASARDGMRVVP